MTIWQYAIARAFRQMSELSEQRPLKKQEYECTLVLEKAVQRREPIPQLCDDYG